MRLSTSEPLLSMRKNEKYEESCPVLAVFTRGVQCINYNLCKHRMYIKCIKPQPRWNEYMIRVYRCVLFMIASSFNILKKTNQKQNSFQIQCWEVSFAVR